MKSKLFLILLSIFVLNGCSKKEQPFKIEEINTSFYVTEKTLAKYSKVYGYFIYNGEKIYKDNGSSGYYYKEYSLEPGDEIEMPINIYFFEKDKKILREFSDINIESYEIKE